VLSFNQSSEFHDELPLRINLRVLELHEFLQLGAQLILARSLQLLVVEVGLLQKFAELAVEKHFADVQLASHFALLQLFLDEF